MGLPATSHKRPREDRSPSPERYGEATSGGDTHVVHTWRAGGAGTREIGESHDWRALAQSAAKPSNDPSLGPSSGSSWGAHAPSAVEHGVPTRGPARESGPGVSARVRLGADVADRSPMERLDGGLLLKIVQMSSPTAWDLCRMSCVSTAWRTACSHSSFWTRLRVGSGSLRAGVEQLAPRCTGLQELFVDDPRCELHVLHPIIVACASSLRRVVIDCDRDASTRNEASVSSILWLISLYCKNVESIELQSDGQEASIGLLEGRTMWYLTSAFRNIRYFACLARGALTKQAIYLMAIAWRDLECVRINMDGLCTDDLLALRKCTSLRALELVGGHLAPLQVPTGARLAPGLGTAERPEDSTGSSVTSELPSWSRTPAVHPHPAEGGLHGHGINPRGSLGGGVVFHPSLELLVLNRVDFEPGTAAALALGCPQLKRILVSGALCSSCLTQEGPCRSAGVECVRKQVDHIQHTLCQVRVALHS